MCCIEGAKLRHPAGSLRKKAEESPWHLGWALAKSAELARVAERKRIIEILEAELTYKEYDLRVYLIDKINGEV